jgi:preprotein translocase subunit YajC
MMFGSEGAGGILPMVLMLGAFFALMYFMIIRPQQKQQKKHQELIASLKKGDEVVLSSGIVGRIFSIEDRFITLEIGGAKMKVVRQAVQGLMGSSSALAASQDENK